MNKKIIISIIVFILLIGIIVLFSTKKNNDIEDISKINSKTLQKEANLNENASNEILRTMEECGIKGKIVVKTYKFYSGTPENTFQIPPSSDHHVIEIECDNHKYEVSAASDTGFVYAIIDENGKFIYDEMLE